MATEIARRSFGMTDKGQVVIIHKTGFSDDGETVTHMFEVRHGVRTIGDFDSWPKAEALARAVAG